MQFETFPTHRCYCPHFIKHLWWKIEFCQKESPIPLTKPFMCRESTEWSYCRTGCAVFVCLSIGELQDCRHGYAEYTGEKTEKNLIGNPVTISDYAQQKSRAQHLRFLQDTTPLLILFLPDICHTSNLICDNSAQPCLLYYLIIFAIVVISFQCHAGKAHIRTCHTTSSRPYRLSTLTTLCTILLSF